MVKIYKSDTTKTVYVSNGNLSNPEDFSFTRNGDLFTVKRNNTPFAECDGVPYSEIIGDDGSGLDITFSNADALESYLNTTFVQDVITNGQDGVDGQDGADGLGFTGGSYNGSTGIVTFDSNDGLGFSTGDLRGQDGADGVNGTNGVDGADGADGQDGADGRAIEIQINVNLLQWRYVGDLVWITLGNVLGAQGIQGEQGIQGVAGQDGADGQDGQDGADAPTKEYASFYLSTGGLTAIGATTSTVVINETSVNSDPLVFSLLLNEVTINKTGDFKIDFGCYFNNSSTNRTEYTFWLEKNGVEVAGSRSGNYQRGYDSGQSSDISMIIPITSGDTIRVRVARTDGGAIVGYQDDNGTRLTIEEK